MNLSPELEKQIVDGAVAEIANRIMGNLNTSPDEMICVSLGQAARILDISVPAIRRLLKETVDLGARDARVTMATIKRLIESRTVKSR